MEKLHSAVLEQDAYTSSVLGFQCQEILSQNTNICEVCNNVGNVIFNNLFL